MKHLFVASTYAVWLVAINIVFYLGGGKDVGKLEYAVLAGVAADGAAGSCCWGSTRSG